MKQLHEKKISELTHRMDSDIFKIPDEAREFPSIVSLPILKQWAVAIGKANKGRFCLIEDEKKDKKSKLTEEQIGYIRINSFLIDYFELTEEEI